MKLKDFNAVILCGGKSSRMGFDKSKLRLLDQNLVEFQVAKFEKIFKSVFVSAKNDKFDNKFKLIKDSLEFQIYSPMLALYSVLSHFKNEFVFIISVDSPKISQKEPLKMLEFLNDNKIIIAKTKSYIKRFCHGR